MTANQIIEKLELIPHPEGGYFKETYRSKGFISANELKHHSGKRNYCTGIYFLLLSDNFSAFHKVIQDEMWHYYAGTPTLLHIITKKGEYFNVTIGNNILEGEKPQYTVEGGDYFAAEVLGKDNYSLCGCTVSPGFDFDDFEMPSRKELILLYPEHEGIITKLTR